MSIVPWTDQAECLRSSPAPCRRSAQNFSLVQMTTVREQKNARDCCSSSMTYGITMGNQPKKLGIRISPWASHGPPLRGMPGKRQPNYYNNGTGRLRGGSRLGYLLEVEPDATRVRLMHILSGIKADRGTRARKLARRNPTAMRLATSNPQGWSWGSTKARCLNEPVCRGMQRGRHAPVAKMCVVVQHTSCGQSEGGTNREQLL